MMKNLVFLTALKSKDEFFVKRHNDYSWMEYAIKTWRYWCEQHGHDLYIFETPIEKNMVAHRPNFQCWLKILDMIDEYDQIMSVDASMMAKWDAVDLFKKSGREWSALKSRENMKWTWESANGYQSMFPNTNFDVKKYFNSGLIILNKKHKPLLEKFKKFYYKNHEEIVKYQTEIVKRGTDQPILNYMVQAENIEINLLSIKYGVNHIFRWGIMNGNWQLKEDPTPFFIKYMNVFIFSGFSDRGKTRNQLMSQTWEMIKHNYK